MGKRKGKQEEVFCVPAFLNHASLVTGEAREHPGLYYRARTAVSDGPDSFPSLAVDTMEDFNRIKGIIERMTKPHWQYGWKECLNLLN